MTKVIIADTFYAAAHKLRRRYRHVINDVNVLITQLEGGETPGDRIQGLSYRVYKVRVRNSDAKRGKSGGYRVIYYLEIEDQTVVLTIYSKTDQSDLPANVIRQIIQDYEQSHKP